MSSQLLVQLPFDIRVKAISSRIQLDDEFELRDNNRVTAFVEGELVVTSTPFGLRCLNSRDQSRVRSIAIIKDISRTGIGLYYHEQLFPQELIEVAFHQRLITALVVRCRFVADACFEVGGKVLSVKSLGD